MTGRAANRTSPGPYAAIQAALLAWFQSHARPLPWRDTRDPYAILVSEIMLQQTQVDRVVPKYHEFLSRFPTIQALASASRAKVIRVWSPLGYNLRAVRLHQLAREVVHNHGGQLPCDFDELLALKGIGRYTAAAVACFAFGDQRPVVDTNVRRVIARAVMGEPDALELPAKEIENAARAALPSGRAYEWNQALMDLGATVCVATLPRCQRCPLADDCQARPSIETWMGGAVTLRETRAAYRTQTRFFGSSRYYRGKIVEALRAASEGLDPHVLARTIKPDFEIGEMDWLLDLLTGLQLDGLVRVVTVEPPEEDEGRTRSGRRRGNRSPDVRVALAE